MATIKFFQSFDDASGIGCLVEHGEYLYSFDLIGGELRARGVRVPTGYRPRCERAVALNSCTAIAKRKLAELGNDYIARNVALYASDAA